MKSTILGANYHTLGSLIRPIRWYRQTGRFPSITEDRQLWKPSEFKPLNGFSVLKQLSIYAKTEPNRVLIVDQDGEHTAGKIYSNVLKLANSLKKKCNIKPCDRVAIMTMAEREMFESFFAIQALGAVPVPINFVNKPKTIAYMFVDSGAKTLIVGKDERLVNGAKRLADFGFLKNVISIKPNVDFRFHDYQDLVAPYGAELNDLSFIKDPPGNIPSIILYTSGTGSAPRGLVYPAENIADATERVTKIIPFTSEDVKLYPVPFYHLAGFISFVGAMYHWKPGNSPTKLVLTDIPRYKEPESIDNALNAAIDQKITIFPGAPFIIEAVLNTAVLRFAKTADEKYLLKDLRLIISGGAVVTKNLVRLTKILNQCRQDKGISPVCLNTFYACTEFGPISVGDINLADEENYDTRRDLGFTAPGVEVRENDALLLEARQRFILPGYLNRPDLPFKSDDGFVLIGDKVGITNEPDGTRLTYLGRNRGSLNIKGNEVSPTDVQDEIENIVGVEHVIVFGVESEDAGTDVLCAFIVGEKQSDIDAEIIDESLKTVELPSRQRPSIYFIEERIPQDIVNGSSKVSPTILAEILEKEVQRLIKEFPTVVLDGSPITRRNYLTKKFV
ncbi:MAG: acyl--CoA ligase [Candidatus Melainabacteria bacterium]|nr:acyl--CoA ligase [Candidatus Melainabacteria bacterium]